MTVIWKSLARGQYHQMVGLVTLAQQNRQRLEEIEAVMIQLTSEHDGLCGGHTGDAIWYDSGSPDEIVKNLLARLNIKVRDGA